MDGRMSDNFAGPNCRVHLVPLETIGDAPDIRAARWECGVPSCTWVQPT
jgi:hypothetical protein